MARKTRSKKKKKIRVTFVTTETALAKQVAKAIRKVGKTTRPKKRPRAGGWSQSGGWLLDAGPSGPWGQQGGWTEGFDRPRPNRGSKVKPIGKRKNVRKALKKVRPR